MSDEYWILKNQTNNTYRPFVDGHTGIPFRKHACRFATKVAALASKYGGCCPDQWTLFRVFRSTRRMFVSQCRGAAAYAGLIGMAEAIKNTDRTQWECGDCGRMCDAGCGWCSDCSPEKQR